MFARMAFVLFFFFSSLHSAEAFCHGSRNSYRASSVGDLVQNENVLLGHVFATFRVQNFSRCFAKCRGDCRCRSFNLPSSGEGKCELNDADSSTVLMKPRRGWRYHHLQMTEVRQGSNTCYEPYENGCCASEPCQNSTACAEIPDHGKPTFKCTCSQGYRGPSCDRRIRSCFDYLWNDKDAASGYYDIWDKNDAKFSVFCDMQPEKLEAWTLVATYDQSVAADHRSKPFFVSYAPNEEVITNSYRLSLQRMKTVLEGMGAERELEWKATCAYSFADRKATSDETVRSRFKTLDIMTFTTNENSVVGLYPFSNKTTNKDMSGFGNHASLYGTQYEDGPLGDAAGSVRMTGSSSSYIKINDISGKLDTRYSITIMMQVYLFAKSEAPLLNWRTGGDYGVHLWAFPGDLLFKTVERSPGVDGYQIRVPGLGDGMWNYVAATYDYENQLQAVYINGTLLKKASVPLMELQTVGDLRIGVISADTRYLNGRVACVRIFSLAFTEEEVKREMEDWKCPQEPEPICHRVDYIKIRGKECYNCNVWATQTNTETFTINAHRGDQEDGCNFKSGSTVTDENTFGVYKAKDAATHACAATAESTTQYWFGGRL